MNQTSTQIKDPAEKRDTSQSRVVTEEIKGENSKIAAEHEVTPLIFEECYVKNDDSRFV